MRDFLIVVYFSLALVAAILGVHDWWTDTDDGVREPFPLFPLIGTAVAWPLAVLLTALAFVLIGVEWAWKRIAPSPARRQR